MKKPNKNNNLLIKNPQICKEWDYNKNELGPENYTYGSTKKVWWICKNNHSWLVSINSRTSGNNGCPFCSGRIITENNSLYIKNQELCKEWDYSKNTISPKDIGTGARKKVWWICKKGHTWEERIYNRSRGAGCPFCAGKKPTKNYNFLKENPKLCKEWDYKKNNLTPDHYLPKSRKKVWWICKNNHSWLAKIIDRSEGNGCPYCSNRIVCKDNCLANTNPELMKEWDFNKNTISPYEIVAGSGKRVWWVCENNHSWLAQICKRKTRGCPKCNHTVSKISTKWLDGLDIKQREKRIRCGKKWFLVDGLYLHIAYEFLGDYWHGNPYIFDPDQLNKSTNTTFGYLLYKTICKFNILIQHGYPVVYRWEYNNNIFRYKYIKPNIKHIIDISKELFINKINKNVFELL